MTELLLESFPPHLDPQRFVSGHRALAELVSLDGVRGAQCTVDASAPDPAPGLDQAGTGMTVWSTIFWDVTGFGALHAQLRNTGSRSMSMRIAWECGESDGSNHANVSTVTLAAGVETEIATPIRVLRRSPAEMSLAGMRGQPTHDDPDGRVYPERVEHVRFMIEEPQQGDQFVVTRLWANGSLEAEEPIEDPEGFFPFIDSFGQCLLGEDAERITSETELRKAWDREDAAMASAPDAAPMGTYGGNRQTQQRYEASGRFRSQRTDDGWILVDPEGLPFFSMGVCNVGHGDNTVIDKRDGWFADEIWNQPEFEDLARMPGHSFIRGYPGERLRHFSYFKANQRRRYGAEHQDAAATALIGKRLRHWGYNTVACFSATIDPASVDQPMPYTVIAQSAAAPTIAGSEGFWRQFPDVFHPEFRSTLAADLSRQAERIRSAWCVGVFIDNELDFGYDDGIPYLTPGIVASPADQPAKGAFCTWLQERYSDISAFNSAWNTECAEWSDVLDLTGCDSTCEAVLQDLLGFESVVLDTYFATSSEELRRVDDQVLYLGTRFSGRAPARVVEAIAPHTDALTYNLYHQSMGHLRLPAEIDLPILIGEFHFGHVGENHFHPGLVPRRDRQAVAEAFATCLQEAKDHPQIVGMHWFCWADQPTTGRSFDGENFNCGLIDVTDRPKQHLIQVSQEFMRSLYGQ